MNPSSCSLSLHEEGPTVTLRVEGRATMNQSSAVRQLAEKCLNTGSASLHLDLRDCTYMDSTFVGTVMYLQRILGSRRPERFAIVSPSTDCCRLLEQMGLIELLPQAQDENLIHYDWMPLPQQHEDRRQFQVGIVQAHKELAALGGPTGAAFRSVAEELESEIASRR